MMAEPLLEARGVIKHYGHVMALDGANFSAFPGEVVALIGDNGAGKSTLVKTLSGTIRPDGGQILIEGSAVRLASPLEARRYGIETVYQDLALAPDLDAAANLHLGREIYRIPFLRVLNRAAMRQRATAAFAELGIQLPDVRAPVATLSGGQRQCVAVARAVAYASKVIFMDEPTAALGVAARERVLDTIRRVRDRGISVILISHNMPEVLAVADRIEVLRMGRRVARFTASSPGKFLTVSDLELTAKNSAAFLVMAVGQTFVIITAGIDLSVGFVLVLSGVVAGEYYLHHGGTNAGLGTIWAGVVIGLAVGAAWGAIQGFVVAKGKVPPLITTLAGLGVAQGLSYLISGGTDLRTVPARLASSLGFGGLGGVDWLIIVSFAVALVFGLVLAHTGFGRYTYAIGSNPEAARRVGINVDLHLIKVYALAGMLSGLAG